MTWIKVFLEGLLYPIRLLLIGLIFVYKYLISPFLPHTCRFYPTCSEYMLISIKEWGIFKGVWLGIKRIVRCRPNGQSGYDFVPQNIKGDWKWTY